MAEGLGWALRRPVVPDGYPPGPPLVPAIQISRLLRDPQTLLRRCRAEQGPTFTLDLPTSPSHVYTCVPEHVTQVFAAGSEVLAAGVSNSVFTPFMGPSSVLVLDGAEHRRQRQLLMPPLGGSRMRAYGQAMQDAAVRRSATWLPDSVLALAPEAQAITLDVMLETVFGLVGDAAAPLRALLAQVVDAAARPHLLLAFLQRDLGPWSPWGRYLRLRERVTSSLQALIDERRGAAEPGSDLLSVLLGATHSDGTPMSDAELHDELITVLVTGHETSAMALCWALHELMGAPEWLDQVLEELDAAPTEPGAPLPLLDAAIAEALRVHPVVPGVGRMVMAPLTLGPWTLQPGHVLTCSTWLSHREPDAWPDPERFLPRRFLDGRPEPGTYYPFGGGNRRCLGEHFARYELRVVLATLLRSWTFRAVAPPVRSVRRSIIMGPSGGRMVGLSRRQ